MIEFFKKLFFFLLLITLLQISIYQCSFEQISRYEKVMSQSPEVILFGSSVEQHIAKSDNDRRDLYEMLNDTLNPSYKVLPVSGGAFHLELFESYINNMFQQYDFKGIVIIPINLRSFSPEWHKRPEYQFELEKLILDKGRYWGGFLSTLSIFKYQYTDNRITQEEFYKTPVMLGDSIKGTIQEFINEIDVDPDKFMKEGFLLSYLYNLQNQHGKVQALERICKSLKKQGVKAFFYITPIDYEKGILHYPKRFEQIVEDNILLLEETIQAYNYPLVNLASSTPHALFDYSARPNEHMNEQGKRLLASALATYLEDNILTAPAITD